MRDNPRLHELRDGEAFAEIMAALQKLGYEYGGLHLNYPVDPRADLLRKYHRSDVIVLTTRPPLDDELGWDRRPIERSNTRLEREILRTVRPYFRTCTRSAIQLPPSAARHLGKYADRAFVKFRVYQREVGGALYSGPHYHARRDPYARVAPRPSRDMHRTAAFLLVRRLGARGPMLVVAFGMDGIMTLVWCYLLRTRLARLLKTPRFVMAEITTSEIPKNAQSLSFANAWNVKLILDVAPDVVDPASDGIAHPR